MKKTTYTWALGALLALAGCSQEELPVSTDTQQAENNTTIVTATLPGTESRLALTEEEGVKMKVDWAQGDQFNVMLPDRSYYDDDTDIVFSRVDGNQFSGPQLEGSSTYYAFYPALDRTVASNANKYFLDSQVFYDFTSQNGDLGNAKLPLYAVSQDGQHFAFQHLSAMLKFNINIPDGASEGDKVEFALVKSTGAYLSRELDLTAETITFPQKEDSEAEAIPVASEHVTVANGTASFYLYLPPMAQGEGFTLYCKKTSSGGTATWHTADVTLKAPVSAGKYYSLTRTVTWEAESPFLYVLNTNAFLDAIKNEMGGCTELAFKANSSETEGTLITAGVMGTPVYAVKKGDCLEVHTAASEYLLLSSNASNMFMFWSSLKKLDLSGFNTAKVTEMTAMFYGCSSLESITFGESFNTDHVTYMGLMFRDCSSLTSLDLSVFNTASVTDIRYMFRDCNALKSITFGESFNTVNVPDMSSMFEGCSSLTSLDLSSFNTANVTDMHYMFYGCSSLESIIFGESFNTASVTYMSSMFEGCSSLTSLDLSSFNTANVTDMNRMFESCSSLTSLDLSSFNTEKVTNMSSMFNACFSFTSLDLSSFTFKAGANYQSMFNCLGINYSNQTGQKAVIYVNSEAKAILDVLGWEYLYLDFATLEVKPSSGSESE